jgi:hypothetical protein
MTMGDELKDPRRIKMEKLFERLQNAIEDPQVPPSQLREVSRLILDQSRFLFELRSQDPETGKDPQVAGWEQKLAQMEEMFAKLFPSGESPEGKA